MNDEQQHKKLLLDFAKAALQGELSCQESGWEWTQNNVDGLAARCFDIADAMMAEALKRGIVV